MTDRELLELAAKATNRQGGYFFRAGGSKGSGLPYDLEGFQLDGGAMWNPLRDSGDAFRLVIELRIQLTPGTYNKDQFNAYSPSGVNVTDYWSTLYDEESLTRRVITRAAAEIGKGMP